MYEVSDVWDVFLYKMGVVVVRDVNEIGWVVNDYC